MIRWECGFECTHTPTVTRTRLHTNLQTFTTFTFRVVSTVLFGLSWHHALEHHTRCVTCNTTQTHSTPFPHIDPLIPAQPNDVPSMPSPHYTQDHGNTAAQVLQSHPAHGGGAGAGAGSSVSNSSSTHTTRKPAPLQYAPVPSSTGAPPQLAESWYGSNAVAGAIVALPGGGGRAHKRGKAFLPLVHLCVCEPLAFRKVDMRALHLYNWNAHTTRVMVCSSSCATQIVGPRWMVTRRWGQGQAQPPTARGRNCRE